MEYDDIEVIVIVTSEENPKTHRMEQIVSHGIDPQSGRTVVMSCCTPQQAGAVFDSRIGEFVILKSTTR